MPKSHSWHVHSGNKTVCAAVKRHRTPCFKSLLEALLSKGREVCEVPEEEGPQEVEPSTAASRLSDRAPKKGDKRKERSKKDKKEKHWKEMEEGEEIAEGERRRGAATEHPSRAGMPGNAAGLFKQRYRSCKQ